MAEEKPIIIMKKKGGHGGHHGGAWKVAYADFVTAMMAFFMVMWLINSAEVSTRKNIAQYFRRPGMFETGSGTPLLLGGAGILSDGIPPATRKDKTFSSGGAKTVMKKDQLDSSTKGYSGAQDEESDEIVDDTQKKIELPNLAVTPDPAVTPAKDAKLLFGETKDLPKDAKLTYGQVQAQRAAEEIRKQIAGSKELQQLLGIVDVKIDADGLNIEIMDTEKSSMFGSGSAEISAEAEEAFTKIGTIIAKMPNTIDVAGHTDSKPFPPNYRGGYSNWELSADRANAARRLLVQSGIAPDRVTSVLGRADRELKLPDRPLAAANRRITIKMRFPNEMPAADPNSLANMPEPPLVEPTKNPESVRQFNPKDILRQKKRHGVTVELPTEPPPTENPAFLERDKIFKDRPVLGPSSPFANF